MPKRKREPDASDVLQKRYYVPYDDSSMDIVPIGRSSRRYTSRSTGSRSSYRKTRRSYFPKYGFPKNRGPYAKVNRLSPELKSAELTIPYTPIRMGDMVTTAGAFTYNGGAPDIFSTFTGTNNGGYIRCVNAVANNASISGRVGRKITCKSVLLNIIWRLGSTIAESTIPVAIRTMLVWDRQPNATQANLSNVLQPVVHINNPYAQPHSPNLLENRDRFRVLYDFRSTLTPGGDSIKCIDKYIKINAETIFNTGSTQDDVATINSGAIYVIHVSDAGQSVLQTASNCPFVTQDIRFRFTDL